MDLKTCEHWTKSESQSRKYVLGFCFKNQQRFCPFCQSRKFWKLADERRRCQRCLKVYHDFTNRWIGKSRLTCGEWLRLIKLFELETSTRTMQRQLNLSYNTVYRAVNILRMAILAQADDFEDYLMNGEIELDECYFGGRRKGNRGRGAAAKSLFSVF